MEVQAKVANVMDLAKVFDFLIKLKGDKSTASSPADHHVILVIDKSYSMQGSALNDAKNAACMLVNECIGKVTFSVAAYDESGEHRTYNVASNAGQIKAYINGLRCGGGTCFRTAFGEIEKIVNKLTNKPQCTVIFLTDGDDTSSMGRVRNQWGYTSTPDKKTAIETRMMGMVATMNERTRNPQLHCIGLGARHDAVFMSKLTKASPDEGTFQYAENSKVLKDKVNNLLPYLEVKRQSLVFQQGNLVQTVNLNEVDTPEGVEEKEDESWFMGRVYAKSDVENKFTLRKMVEGNVAEEVEVEAEEVEITQTVGAEQMIELLNQRIIISISKLTNTTVTHAELDTLLAEFKEINDKLDLKMEECNTIKMRTVRAQVKGKVLEAKQTASDFWNLLRRKKAGERITNEQIAKMNDVAYSGAIKKRHQTTLDKRAVKNMDLMTQWFSSLERIGRKYQGQEKELRDKYDDALKEVEPCQFTLDDAIECLEGGDALCIPLKISRPEAAIADPSRVVIESIGSGFVSAYSFKEQYEASISKTTSQEDVHGGFSKKSGAVVKGKDGQDINAVVPLCLGPEFWEAAKIWNKMNCALATTLDPLGYTFDQVVTLPFLVLARALANYQEKPTEHNHKVYQLVLNTCKQIMRDASGDKAEIKLMDTVKEQLKNFMNSPEGRTQDIVSNLSVLMMRVHVAQALGALDFLTEAEYQKFLRVLAEEQARRAQINHKGADVTDDITMKFFNVNKGEWVTKHVKRYRKSKQEEFSGKDTGFRAKFVNHLKLSGHVVEETEEENDDKKEVEVLSNAVSADWEVPDQISESMSSMIKWAKSNFKKLVSPVLSLAAVLRGRPNPDVPDEKKEFTLENMGIDTNEKLMAFVFQNYLHYKNFNRRSALANGTYVDPYSQEQATKFIKRRVQKAIDNLKSRGMTQIDQEFEKSSSEVNAKAFAMTTDLNEAAGALMGTYIGRNISTFTDALSYYDSPHVKEKLMMLLNGTYLGVSFYNDGVSWCPKRHRMCKVWKRNRHQLSKDEWIELLEKAGVYPSCTQKWYESSEVSQFA